MNKTCKKCENEIPKLDFTEEARLKLYGLIYQDLKLFAVKQLMDEHRVTHRDAKIIVAHLNKNYGQCRRCDYSDLDKESIECPKCGAFNYNLKGPIFNQNFCSLLEYSLPFEQLENKELRGFWCDGIESIPYDIENLALNRLKQNRSVKTRAWTGVSGQDIYEMTILFGEQSINCFEQGLSLEGCIYSENADDWIKVEPDKKKIEIRLK